MNRTFAQTSPPTVSRTSTSDAPIRERTQAQEDNELKLRQALQLNSPALINELYEIALRQMTFEMARQTRLDGKATSLLSAVGLSLTVILTLGGQVLLTNARNLRALGPWYWRVAVVLFGLAAVIGLVASWEAVQALKVKKSEVGVSEAQVFDVKALRDADQFEQDADGLADYRRNLVVHFWQAVQNQAAANQARAAQLWRGQRVFMGFLLVIFSLSVFLVAALWRYPAIATVIAAPAESSHTVPGPSER